MKKRLSYLILPVITLILEILPYGAICNFANPEGEPLRKTFSYFDLTPFGYANFAPFYTAVITCIILIILTAYCVTGKDRLAVAARNLLLVCSFFSVGPLALGVSFFSVVGGLITVSLVAELLLLHFGIKATKKDAAE